MPRGDEFSLAAALFGWPAADGFHSPDQQVPEAWLLALTEQHSDADVWVGVFRSCRSGRDLALRTAPKARLRLDTSIGSEPTAWLQRLHVLKQSLETRGRLPTSLQVECADTLHSAQACSVLPTLLYGVDTTVTELILDDSAQDPQRPSVAYTSTLSMCAAAAPHLHTLTLERPACLPPPAYLPQLKELSVSFLHDREEWDNTFVDSVLTSIAPFTTQLTSITLSGDMSPAFDFDWDLLFTAPSHTLTHFSTNTELDDTLLGILLDSAPALKCVSVDMISLDEDTHMNRTWAVETVCVESEEDGLECVRYLPKRADGGSVTVKGPCWQPEIHVTGVEGLNASLVQRFPEFEYGLSCIQLMPANILPQADQNTALVATLRQLSALRTCDGALLKVELWDWDWSALGQQCARALADLLPTLPSLSVSVVLQRPLTVNVLGVVLAMGAHVRGLCVPRLALRTDTHANTPWPWERLTVVELDMCQIWRLPNPAGHGSPRKLECLIMNLDVTSPSVTQLVLQRLPHLIFTTEKDKPSDLVKRSVELPCPRSKEPESLAPQLSVLQGMNGTRAWQKEVQVRLSHWPMTLDTIQTLAGLPSWHGSICFNGCTWPLELPAYDSLASIVPSTYSTWQLVGATDALVQRICAEASLKVREHGKRVDKKDECVLERV